jgi:copper chaperone CopZ
MIQTFQIKNVKCSGCARSLKNKLRDFNDVQIDLSVTPRTLSLEIENHQIDSLKEILRNSGYPIIDDELSALEEIKVLVNSYTSCMIGKIEEKLDSVTI